MLQPLFSSSIHIIWFFFYLQCKSPGLMLHPPGSCFDHRWYWKCVLAMQANCSNDYTHTLRPLPSLSLDTHIHTKMDMDRKLCVRPRKPPIHKEPLCPFSFFTFFSNTCSIIEHFVCLDPPPTKSQLKKEQRELNNNWNTLPQENT